MNLDRHHVTKRSCLGPQRSQTVIDDIEEVKMFNFDINTANLSTYYSTYLNISFDMNTPNFEISGY